MPLASSSSTSARLLTLLSLLQVPGDRPARELAERLGVSERTVRRDVERLRELDYAIVATRGPEGGYRLGTGERLPPLLLDEEQAVAVAIALRTASVAAAGIEEASARALATIRRTLPSRLAERVEDLTAVAGPPAPGSRADPAVLLRIARAIHSRRELRFDSSGSRDGTAAYGSAPRRIEPHHLLLRGQRWYLLGWSTDRQDWRVHRVDRIAPRTHDGAAFAPRSVPGGDPARFLIARLTGSSGIDPWPCWGGAVLRAGSDAIAPFIGDGAVEPIDEERCRVRMGSWSWGALAATIGRFDVRIEDAEPAELAEAFVRLSARFAAAGAHLHP